MSQKINVLLLKKIEELTLYIIELKKNSKNMKTIKLLFAIILATFTACTKEIDKSNLMVKHDCLLYNLTTDTLLCELKGSDYTYTFKMLPLRLYNRCLSYSMKVSIYKLNDTINPYIIFEKGKSPFNYKIDLLNFKDIDSACMYNVVKHNGVEYYEVKIFYVYEIKTENIINP